VITTSERPRDIWTRLTVDPLADPLAQRIAGLRWVTPNRVTGMAFLLSLAAAGCFASGWLRIGGAAFLVRFFLDCLDGKVARAQRSSSERGAFLDIAADVVGISLTFAALAWHQSRVGGLPTAVGLGLLAALVVYNWALSHRKRLAERIGGGSGGSEHQWQTTLPGVSSWVALCRRLNMSAVPWVLEAEIASLGLVPLLVPHLTDVALVLVLLFYALASGVNLRRIWTIAEAIDTKETS
jgi:phosphatidylglycerophosphate synthase